MASSSNSSSFHVPRVKYDVFISFRGEDTRTSFLSHLVKELHHNQIDFYVDYANLHPGDEISSTLLQATEEAFISLVIFSKNYASSMWCLEELVKIIECMERDQRIVIPIFYNVDPSDVRHQKGTFGEAFDMHKDKYKYERDMVKVKSWRYALRKAANLSGFHYPSRYQNESKLIEEIVKEVSKKLSHIVSSESKGLVGIDKSLKCIESLLAIELSGVRILGIWGMGGIGKTAIAEAIFGKYSSQYEGCCFLKNVREESQKYGLPYLCEKLVSKLLEGENLLLQGPAKATSTNVQRRLSRKKVFIVLDDVDTLTQLEHLTREQICLGPSSRVIVTTRDKQILTRVHGIYEVQGLNFENSLQLFCLNAFGKVYPKIGYEKLSRMVVAYANGIPLALKVLGSFLYSRSIEAWESALRKLRIYPNMDIFNVLKFSFDGLDDSEKNIFLDIAFFFKGQYKDDVIRLLDSFGFFAAIGIDNLQRKALITISCGNTIQMHDLIEQMGWEMVRQESIKDPGKRSRLRNPEDIYNVLKNSRGTDLVEGIMLDLSQIKDLHLNADTFKKMPNLRFLKLYNQSSSNVHIPTILESFSDELRYLEWSGYPLKSLPSNFCAENLVELHMPCSQVSKLWDGEQDLVNLKKINLQGCKQLVELPDFNKASNLKILDLQLCERLYHFHPSILSIHTLERLILYGCQELKSLNGEIRLKSLKYLNVSGCKKLKSLKGGIHLKSLEVLYVGCCSSLEEFSMSSEELRWLDFKGTRIDMLHSSIGLLSRLERFDLSYLRLKSLPNELCFLISLEELRLFGCKELIELPHNIKVLSQLKILELGNCCRLRSLPELPPSIRRLDATNCTSLETVFSLKVASNINKESISFENCMRLDEHSLYNIMEDAHLTMVGATIRNVLKDRYSKSVHDICYPESKIPEWFRYQTRQDFITIELDQPYQLLGFVVCCVISQLPSNIWYVDIDCEYYFGDAEWGRYGSKWLCNEGEGWNSNHVYIWYDPYGCDRILEGIEKCRANDLCPTYNQKISFEFIVKPAYNMYNVEVRPAKGKKVEENFNFAETSKRDCSVIECGIYPIHASDILDFIQKVELELESNDKSKIYQDLDELDLDTLKSDMILKMKKEPVPQRKIFDLASSSNCNDLGGE